MHFVLTALPLLQLSQLMGLVSSFPHDYDNEPFYPILIRSGSSSLKSSSVIPTPTESQTPPTTTKRSTILINYYNHNVQRESDRRNFPVNNPSSSSILQFRRQAGAHSNLNDPSASASSHYTTYYRNRNHFSKNIPTRRNLLRPSQNDLSTLRPLPFGSSAITPTPLFRTAPHPDSLWKENERPSSTQQMQRDSSSLDIVPSQMNDQGKSTREERRDHLNKKILVTEQSEEQEKILFEPEQRKQMRGYYRPKEPLIMRDNETWLAVKDVVEAKQRFESERKEPTHNSPFFQPFIGGRVETTCDKKAVYCEEFTSYPKELLDHVLKNTVTTGVFQKVFGDSLDNSTVVKDPQVVSRYNAPDHADQETSLCASIEHTIYPKAARNKENKWMFVVNHDEYIQGVRVEKCLGEGNSCLFGEGAPTGYQSFCRQKYIYKKLLALTAEGRTMTDTFRMPSCCTCHIRSSFVQDRISPPFTSVSFKEKKPVEHASESEDLRDPKPTAEITTKREIADEGSKTSTLSYLGQFSSLSDDQESSGTDIPV